MIYIGDWSSDVCSSDLAKLSGHVFGVKLYPAGATTFSDEGVTRLSRCFHALEKMTEVGMPLLIHGESRSEERRVGKEYTSRCSMAHERKKNRASEGALV